MKDVLPTAYASAERSSAEELEVGASAVASEPSFCEALQLVPNLVLILDDHRQVVFANEAAVRVLRRTRVEDLVGLRHGDAWGCVHHDENSGGCGTSESCRYCGAVNAVLTSQKGEKAVDECRMRVRGEQGEEAVDLRVWATPVSIGSSSFTMFTAVDIAEEKRKAFLERIFLHDILNTASALRGFSTLLGMGGAGPEEESLLVQRVGHLSERIIDEINAQKTILAAESGELIVQARSVASRSILEEIHGNWSRPDFLDGRNLVIGEGAADVALETDPVLLVRVLSNMAKNAIEASSAGESIEMDCRTTGNDVVFSVRNPGFMPEAIRLQVFQRSFSTKGPGRGLGTYSMKFLAESYLHGSVSFESAEDLGTTFRITVPRTWPAAKN
ncbi:MAG: sensor histidine kinase [Fibrobacteria bacterium]|nr:sensor histidine kinase [Fibrobacteria bacterium]